MKVKDLIKEDGFCCCCFPDMKDEQLALKILASKNNEVPKLDKRTVSKIIKNYTNNKGALK